MKPPQNVINHAAVEAKLSPCAKTRRGASVFHISPSGRVALLGGGFNGAPEHGPDSDTVFKCDGSEECRARCSKRCVHAEQRALDDFEYRDEWPGAQMLHVKIDVDGGVVPGGPPSCWQCARAILDSGAIDGVWLFENTTADGVWNYYPSLEFYNLTMKNRGLV